MPVTSITGSVARGGTKNPRRKSWLNNLVIAAVCFTLAGLFAVAMIWQFAPSIVNYHTYDDPKPGSVVWPSEELALSKVGVGPELVALKYEPDSYGSTRPTDGVVNAAYEVRWEYCQAAYCSPDKIITTDVVVNRFSGALVAVELRTITVSNLKDDYTCKLPAGLSPAAAVASASRARDMLKKPFLTDRWQPIIPVEDRGVWDCRVKVK